MTRFLPRTFWQWVFTAIMIAGAWATYVRVFHGLGGSTNLNDQFPWGLWIGFDVLCGVGLAAGGFTLAAIVHIFNIKDFKPVVRPAILTAFLGYLLVVVGLMFDLGQPQRIWHLLIYHNIHSPLFEIGWCVMLYTTVLALEFSPVVFDALGMKAPVKILRASTIPLIIAGIPLSTLHQSTLGTMLTILPYRIHPLWYSPLFPFYFFLTAVAAGMAMTVFESYHSARTYGYPFELKLVSSLTKYVPYVLGLYLVVRMTELFVTGNIRLLLANGAPAVLFIIEIIGGVLVPILFFADPKTRNDQDGITWAAFFTMGGLILNRMNASLIFMEGALYFPSLWELAVSIGLTCLGIIMYDAAVRILPILPETKKSRLVQDYKQL